MDLRILALVAGIVAGAVMTFYMRERERASLPGSQRGAGRMRDRDVVIVGAMGLMSLLAALLGFSDEEPLLVFAGAFMLAISAGWFVRGGPPLDFSSDEARAGGLAGMLGGRLSGCGIYPVLLVAGAALGMATMLLG